MKSSFLEELARNVSVGISPTVVPVADQKRTYSGTVQELAGIARNVDGGTHRMGMG